MSTIFDRLCKICIPFKKKRNEEAKKGSGARLSYRTNTAFSDARKVKMVNLINVMYKLMYLLVYLDYRKYFHRHLQII